MECLEAKCVGVLVFDGVKIKSSMFYKNDQKSSRHRRATRILSRRG